VACFHPLRAWRLVGGSVVLREPTGGVGVRSLRLPCGKCIGCRTERARHWALRASLELQRHECASFVTLTYSDEFLPPTLRKSDLSGYLKRLRKSTGARIRFFASGEYGDSFGRPHYHAILFGLNHDRDKEAIRLAWGIKKRDRFAYGGFVHRPFGIVDVDVVTPKVISYVAGYASKKLAREYYERERVDPETGEVYRVQPPFILVSRGGRSGKGLAGEARDRWPTSWRKFAVVGGVETSVPRYLHEGWKRLASDDDIAQLEAEKALNARFRTREELKAGEANALARHKLAEQRRARQ